MTAEFADISVGVYEGKEKLNILVTRTKRGEELVQGAISAGFLDADTLGDKDIAALDAASMNKKKRAIAKCSSMQKINSAEGIALLRMNRNNWKPDREEQPYVSSYK
jgi:coenzyme F420-reducing hydrogenase beta subunit